jgi:lantibiotic modifying enzyme
MCRATGGATLWNVSMSDVPPREDSAGGQLRPGWWTRAIAPHERDACGLLSRPSWADVVEGVVAAAAPPALPALPALPVPADRPDLLLVPLRPFLGWVRDQLAAAARRLPPGQALPEQLAAAYTAAVGRQLAGLARRTMEAELDRASGGDGGQRDDRDLIARLCTPAGLAAFLTEYPVLARLLGRASELAAEAGSELLTRFAADRAALVSELLGGTDPGPAVAIEPGLGDRHRHGRSVTAVSFADGRTVIYKPRDLGAHLAFAQIADWLGGRVPSGGLRMPAAVARPGYGWLEFIAAAPLPRRAEATEFYRREGVLLAALYAVHACDMHRENIIACGELPVLIDVETVFHPALPMPQITAADPAAEALASSVQCVGLLPYVTVGEDGAHDQSGMSGGQAGNIPRFDGEAIEPGEHEAAILEGFRLAYDAIAANRTAFSRLLASCADLEVRTVVRPTRGYARLMAESTHPDLLRDAADRDRALGVLRAASAHHRLWSDLADYEIADLWDGDIPLLTTRPARPDLWTSAGVRLPGRLDQPGLSCALASVAAMGEVDRRDQEWIISASLAIGKPNRGHRGAQPLHGPVTAAAAEPARLLAAACGLADQIIARAIAGREASGRVNWLGLQLVEDTQWMLLPMGAGLADGYLGVALFLAQLAALTGIDRYTDAAWRAVGALPGLLAALEGRPELVGAIGCGGLSGLGGISYGLARMSRLLNDAELGRWAGRAAELAATVDLSGAHGWTTGTAGCLAAMTSVHAELGSGRAADLARACADRLCALAEETDGRCGPGDDVLTDGFASGPAGVGWALVRFAETKAEQRYLAAGRLAARRAIEASPPDDSLGWCSGTAGRLLARICLPAEAGGLEERARALAGRPVLEDLSLCHGEAGVADALTVLTDATGGRAAHRAQRRRAGLVLDVISRHASVCGTPGGVSTPGLLNGLAGIGYGLLRLGFSERVPSALLLQAGPPPKSPLTIPRLPRGTHLTRNSSIKRGKSYDQKRRKRSAPARRTRRATAAGHDPAASEGDVRAERGGAGRRRGRDRPGRPVRRRRGRPAGHDHRRAGRGHQRGDRQRRQGNHLLRVKQVARMLMAIASTARLRFHRKKRAASRSRCKRFAKPGRPTSTARGSAIIVCKYADPCIGNGRQGR